MTARFFVGIAQPIHDREIGMNGIYRDVLVVRVPGGADDACGGA